MSRTPVRCGRPTPAALLAIVVLVVLLIIALAQTATAAELIAALRVG